MVTIGSTLRKHDGENFHKINDQETQSESPLETGKEWEEKRAIQVLVQRSTLRKHDGENFHKINDQETQSESPLETGKEWEEKRAIQVLVQRKDPKEERYIVP
ncbi:hypothetical protein T4D_15059 [Trichinella pseudospiralis]|uniref:Uncharacterized protein n=1 Tax=Trichinella pseudospiralis TaxID=6337 RepID=A0A0V1FFJ8_TRIPS|nr:hypothetical protein T4D_15059 [Trichinella pseudospiralis]